MTTVETIDLFCDFVEVAIHNILYIRKLYPPTIFTPRKKYGITVYQSEHPLLNEYITQVLKAVQAHAQNNQLKQVLLKIQSDKKVVENYVFDIIQLENKTSECDPILVQLEQALRTFCIKLTNSVTDLKPLPNNSEFDIVLLTTEYSYVAFNEEQENKVFPWIPVNKTEFESLGIIPIHGINADKLILQVYLEEYTDSS